MYDEMPPLVAPSSVGAMTDRDPVTGAPRPAHLRRLSSGQNYPGYQPAMGYAPAAPIFAPPYGYAYAGYNPAPYLVPSPQNVPVALPGSPNLVPVNWLNAYNEYYGGGTPLMGARPLERSPSRRYKPLYASPGNSPYGRMIPLPALPDEDEDDTETTWRTRLWTWLKGEGSDPHSQFMQEIYIHECLDRRQAIRWFVTHPPHTIRTRDPPDANDSAFEPPLASCRIVCGLLPWAIEVKAHSRNTYITVLTLLGDIYKALAKPIERQTYENLPPKFRRQVDACFEARVYDMRNEYSVNLEYEQGIKKVDFLLDKTRFGGLVQHKGLMNTFEMKLLTAAIQ